MPVIFWFRRDLRLVDNIGLKAAFESGKPVIPLFIFDPAILQSERLGVPRLKFMLKALNALKTDLHKHQCDLLIRHGNPAEVIQTLAEETGADALYYNVDYTPYARQRDGAIKDIDVFAFHDRLLIPPDGIEKSSGGAYTVYTPFKNKWHTLDKSPIAEYHISADNLYTNIPDEPIPSLADLGFDETIAVPEIQPQEQLEAFLKYRLSHYADSRDKLGNPADAPKTGTSFLSPYIRFGLISTRTIYWACREAYSSANEAKRDSINKFVDELIWYEFYTHILWHFPDVKTHNFNRKYDSIQWRTDGLSAWKNGETGYPVIDAAMRQLKAIGWMHNRARMIVASFLTKDLLIDWREGELHFMQWLIDGDLAANNGGWQWAAGTGTDAQPYFRIFNPVSQSQKFDPDGAYIRHWIPELQDVPDKYIHAPWQMPHPPQNYPAPIVDHSEARQIALETYQKAGSV